MAEDPYFFDGFTTLDLTETDSDTSLPVAGITGVTIIPNVSMEQLYTGDSAKIEAQQQHEYAVDVGIEYAKWDQDASVVQQWLAGGGGSTATSWTDTNDPQKFEINAVWDSVGGDRTLDTTVTGITFPEMPVVDSSMGEYLSRDLSGTGEDLTDLTMTDNTTA
jgi:hypothetical protein